MGLVYKIAHQYKCELFPLEDAVQEGCFGLLKALDDFDSQCGVQFSTYAYYWIRQSCKRAMQNQNAVIRIPAYMQARLCDDSQDTTPLMMQARMCRRVSSIDHPCFQAQCVSFSSVAEDRRALLEDLFDDALDAAETRLVKAHFKLDKPSEVCTNPSQYRVRKAVGKLKAAAGRTKYQDLRGYLE